MYPTPETPGPGQESVWDYPRPPRLEPAGALIEILLDGHRLARTEQALRVLETSHPPTYYLPASCFSPGALVPVAGSTVCEWKGRARYADLVLPASDGSAERRLSRAAWSYPQPQPGFTALVDHWAVMPGEPLVCLVDGEPATPQSGGFYGGWITSRVVGPFKGAPGTLHW